jgi:hypothetical protein
VLFAFVLHELLISDLSAVIANAVRALDSSGRIAVLDFAAPADARMWRGVLHAIEGRSMDAFLDVDLAAILTASGIAASSQKLAGGRAQLHSGARARPFVG